MATYFDGFVMKDNRLPMLALSDRSTESPPPWHFRELLVAFFLGFFLGPWVIVSTLAPLLPEGDAVKSIATTLASYLVWLVFFFWLSNRYGSGVYREMGLVRDRSWGFYWVTGLIFGHVILFLGWFMGWLAQRSDVAIQQPYAELPLHQLRWIALIAVLMAPFMEELIFRGFLQSSLYRYMHPIMSVVITTVVFTLFHSLYYGNWMALVYVALLGLIFSLVRYTTHSVIPCIIGHFLNNAIAAISIIRIDVHWSLI